MQYILTQEEIDALVPREKYEKMLKKATKLAEKLADQGKWKRSSGGPGCVKKQTGYDLYCDGCPAFEDCPKEYRPVSK